MLLNSDRELILREVVVGKNCYWWVQLATAIMQYVSLRNIIADFVCSIIPRSETIWHRHTQYIALKSGALCAESSQTPLRMKAPF